MEGNLQRSKLELWGGVECTINRVGDKYHNQLSVARHEHRADDIDAIATLGIKRLRYPVLWEVCQPSLVRPADFSQARHRLYQIRSAGIEPVAGLLHHGSGPKGTSLLDPAFPEKLGSYARQVAENFPWINAYTPVNEPLTTARFSGLYGYWYPHHKAPVSFAKALINQLKGVVMAMTEIRKVNPSAQLLQTEDLARIDSTPKLEYQASFENERRWLTFDLLCGRVTPHHPMWSYLRFVGIDERDLNFFLGHPCPPDLLGLNYYITSERFLDDDITSYHPSLVGGNGVHHYVDVEAVRAGRWVGPRELLLEVHRRYQIPAVVSEVHMACTVDEQIRWISEMWDSCLHARSQGMDLRAMTAWSLLGAYDWDKLCTEQSGCYEAGAFDVSSGSRQPTELADALQQLARFGMIKHPSLSSRGWWHEEMKVALVS